MSSQKGEIYYSAPYTLITYCTSDPDDNIQGSRPTTSKLFVNTSSGGLGPGPLSSINNASTPTTAVIRPSTLTPGTTYYFTYNAKDFRVIVYDPATLTSNATGSVCSGVAQNYTITTTADPTTYTWSRASVVGITPATGSGSSNSITETLINSTTSPIAVTYTIVPAGGCSTNLTYTVTVNPTPSITSASTGSVCSGTPFIYTITSNTSVASTTYNWSRAAVAGISNPAVAGQTTSNIFETLVNTTGAPINVKYFITPSVGSCTGSTFTLTVTVNPSPTLTSATTGSICSGTAQAYTITTNPTPTTISWTRPAVAGITPATGSGASSLITETLTNTTASAISVVYNITLGSTGCSTATYTVTVDPKPAIIFNALPSICADNGKVNLASYVSPAGGTFSGSGVTGNTFDPSKVVPGTYPITYTYTDPLSTCTNSSSQNITVNAVPTITIATDFMGTSSPVTSLSLVHCEYDTPADAFTYSPITGAGGTGVFTKIAGIQNDGITDLGSGNATFNPGSAGLGYHDVVYKYTTAAGCTNSKIINVRVGTDIKIIGLPTSICSNASPVTFSYSHWSVDPLTPYTLTLRNSVGTIVPGITDNGSSGSGGGTATFSPSTSGIGMFTLTYTYTDDLTCVNTITKTINVLPATSADFTGLNAVLRYCQDATDVTLTGATPNLILGESGTFSGSGGSIVNLGGGVGTFKPSTLAAGSSYPVTYTFINSSGCTDVKTKNVTIAALPNVYSVTGTGSYCQGSSGLPIKISNTEVGIKYQLYNNGTADSTQVNGTGSAFTWKYRKSGSYTVIATNPTTGCTALMSGTVVITELAQAAITVQPVNDTTCVNGSATFSITATGQNLSYAWTKSGVPIGINSDVLAINNVTAADNGNNIICTVTSSCGGPLTSNTAVLNVLPTTSITTQPTSATKCTGGSVSFTVITTGSGLTFQWKKNGVDVTNVAGKISGSTSSSLSITNLVSTDMGSYTCYITGTCGSVTSNPAVLQVDDPIVITTQPTSKSVCSGSNILFSTIATGTNLTYQWYFNNGGGPVAIVGATNTNYPINGVGAANVGTYYCTISSLCGTTVNTNPVTLSLLAPTAITTNPTGTTVCEGGSANLSVVATGSNLTYQWIKDGVALVDNAIISGSSTANLTLSGVGLANAGNYTCRVTGDCGILTTPAAVVNVEQAVTFNTQPTNQTVCPGSSATFTLNANGSNLTYEWQKNTVPIGGATNSNYTIASAVAADAGTYRCRINNACGDTYSNEVTLTVNTTTSITTQPTSVATCENLNASFTVIATGTNLTYQWYKNGSSIVGATNSALTLNNVTTTDAANYYCVVNGSCGNATSATVSLSVDVAPVITTQPLSQTVCPGMAASLSIVVPTGTNMTYQWVKDGVNIGTNSPVYNITAFAAGDAGTYYCKITNNCGTTNSNSAVLTLGTPVSITTNPTSLSKCIGSIATFTVVASGSNLTYQWLKNGSNLSNGGTVSGATSQSLTISGVAVGDIANYSCIVSNTCNSQTSTSASLNVSQAATITQQPQSATGCLGQPLNIVTIASGTNLSYQWYRNGVAVGLNNPVYAIASFVAGDAGVYRCEITNGCGTVVSDNATIALGTTTAVTTDPVSATRCLGSDVNFLINANGTNLTYQWKKDGVSISDNGRISASNTNSLSITGIIASDAGTYTCDAIGDCGTVTSNGAVLTIKNAVTITSQPSNVTVCNGGNATFNVIATGDNLTYEWQKDGVAIVPAETSSSLVLTGVNNASQGVYNCKVSNYCGDVISDAAYLVVEDNLSITSQPTSLTRCEGSNVSFTVVNAGPSATTYQWYKDGVIVTNNARITGATSAILNINSITTADQGSYSCKLNSNCGFDESDIATLTVQQNVTITVNPTSFSVLTGNTANFTVVATGNITGYQWRKDGVDLVDGGNISGALTANLTISNAAAADQGAYTCFVIGTCNSIPSSPANLTVLTSSVITTQPIASTTICEGGTLNLFIATVGSGHTYQWKKNGSDIANGGNISGATTSTLTISNVVVADQAAYTCLVDGVEGSSPAIVMINPATLITTHPLSASKCVGDNVVFVVAASGANLTYQWQKNNADIGGATSSTFTINPLVDGNDGIYTCVVKGTCGIKTSNPATLVVNKNTSITTHPSDATICEGATQTLSIVADGDNLTYQWKKNGSAITDLGNVSGTSTSSLVISNALTTDAGVYSCTVTGSCGSATSNFATLTVNSSTVITTQPIGRSKCAGDNVVFTVVATGTNLTYRWKFNGVNLTDDGNITGSFTSTLSIATITQAAHQGTYTCVVTGTCGTATSDPAVLTVNNATTITSQPIATITICQNGSTTISIAATGGNLTYQWTKNGSAISDGGNISGTSTNSLVISNALTTDAGFYSCTVTGTCSNATSNVSQLIVNTTTTITLQPVNKTICEGDNAQFIISATGTNLTYQWKFNNVDIPLATSNVYTINGALTSNAGAYTCVVTGTCGVLTSNPANLVVNQKVTITTQPVDATICQDNNAIFILAATGSNLTYQWKKNNVSITDNARITGSTTNQLQIAVGTNADEGIYKCDVFSTCGSTTSNSVTLTVNDSTKILVQPISQSIVQGSTALFSVSASGIITGYQWQRNGINLTDGGNISGSSTNSLSITNVTSADAASYRCIVTGTCGTLTSNLGVLTVNVPVTITTSPASQTKCSGESVSFSVVASGSILSYQWTFNGSNLSDGAKISGSQTANLVISSLDITNAGTYACIVTGNYNIANSNSATLTINEAAIITKQPTSQTVCDGDWLVLEVVATGAGVNYQWEKDNVPLVADPRFTGINASLLVITNVTSADAGSYRCTISNTCKTEKSNPAVITINPKLSFSTQPTSATRCEGQTINFFVTATGTNISYQWYKNGVALANSGRISGATSSILIINTLTLADQGNYTCTITDNCSFANSSIAVLTMKMVTTITSQPSDTTVCEGQDAFFEVSAQGDNISYQWQKNGINMVDGGNIFGSNSSVLIIQAATLADPGAYRCNITGGCNDILTNPANLTVSALPVAAGVISGSTTVCQGDKNVLYVVPAITNATSYVWSLPYGATIVRGDGTRSIEVDFSNAALSGSITVYGTNGCANGATSPALAITINPLPTANAGIDQIVCGTSTTFNANPVVGTWTLYSGDGVISNPNLFNSGVINLNKGDNQFIWSVTQSGCTSWDTVKITNALVAINAGVDQTVCTDYTDLQALIPLTGGSWSIVSGSGVFTNTLDPNSHVTSLTQDINRFEWKTSYLGCVSRDTVTIYDYRPKAPNAGLNQTVDVNYTTLDGSIPEAGTTGFWSLISGSGTFADYTDPKTAVTNLMPGTNIFTWSVKRQSCLLSDTVKVEDIMIDIPEAGPNQTLCNNSTYLDAIRPTIGTGEWSVMSGTASFVDKYNNTTKVTNLGHGANWLKWTVRTSGLGMKYDSVLIMNNETTIANAGPDVTLCKDSINLNANTPIYGTGVWTLNSGSGQIVNTSNPNTLIRNLGQINELKWTITNFTCISEDFVKVTNNTPTVANAGPDQTICLESTTLYPNTPTVGTGSWSLVSGSGIFNGNVVTKLAPDQNIFRYNITMGICVSYDDVIITNNKPTTPDAGYDQNLCVDTVTLNANAATQGSGVWSIINGSGSFSSLNTNKPHVTGLADGMNIFRWTITKNGCSEQDEVIISSNFILATAGSDEVLCVDSVQLKGSNPLPGVGFWSVVGSSGALFDNQNSPNTYVHNLSKGVNTLRWTVRNVSCESYDDVVITNNSPTTAFAGENQAICGTEATLQANTATFGSGIWTIMSGSGSLDNNLDPHTTIRNLGVGKNILRWTITMNTCVSYSEVVITRNLPSNVFAGNDQVACSDTAVLFANAPTIGIGSWSIISGAGIFDNPYNYNTTIRKLGKGPNILKWTVASSDCRIIDTVVITSSIPTKSIAGADQILCSETTTLGGNQATVGTGQWTLISGSVQITNPSLPNSGVTAIERGTSLLRWTITENGCESFDEMKITNNLPSTPFAGYDQTICGDSTRLFADPPTIGTGKWSLVSGDAYILSPNSNQTRILNIKFGDNTFRWKVTNSNCTLYDDVIVTSNYAYANAGSDRDVNTSTTQLIGNVPASGTGTWSLSAGQATIQNPSQFDTWVTDLGAGANIFTWSINNNGCIASDEITINYIVMPIADFNPSVSEGCSPLSVTFVNTSIGGMPYFWEFGDGQTSSETNITHIYDLPGTYKVVLTATAPLGLTVKKEQTITVYGHPIAKFDISPKVIYIPGQTISCFNYSDFAETSIWDFGDGNSTITARAPKYEYRDTGRFDITLKILNSHGCADSTTTLDIVHVIKRSEIMYPEAFTPNPYGSTNGAYNSQDRTNDVFYPIIIDGEITNYDFRVYNRLGVLVFKSNDIKVGWDGYYQGKLLPEDVYIYTVSGRYNSGDPFQITHNVLLIRKNK